MYSCVYIYAALSRPFSLAEKLLMVRRLMQLMLASLVRTRFACAFNMKFKEAEWTERNFQCSTCRSAIGRTMCVVISVVDLSLLDLPIKRKNLFVLNRVIFRQHFT